MKKIDFKNINWLKVTSRVFFLAAFVVMMAASAHIGYSYAELHCCIEHLGSSAPNNLVFTMLLPYCFLVGMLFAAGFGLRFIDKKRNK